MKQNIIKFICFMVTLIISINIISTIMNMGNTDMTVTMSEASLPTVSMLVGDRYVNTQYGYTGNMQINYLRDTLTPLPEDRKLYVKIKLWGEALAGISYEVRSLDGTRLVESTDVYDYIKQQDEVTVDFPIKDLIDRNQEYMLITILHMDGGKDVRYYTRIIQSDNLNYQEKLEFVCDFNEKTFDKEKAKAITTYLESNEEGDNTTYQYVNIHSSFNQITWGDLNIDSKSDVEAQVLELDSTTASIRLKYIVNIKNGKSKEAYKINEYYRIRYTEERIYLLEYERYMNQIFNPNNDVFINDKIMLGIAEDDIDLIESNDGGIIVFCQGNSLYEYRNNGNLARIFSFYDENNMDIRTINNNHGVKIMDMDDAGNVRFLVYGYMNRGQHEGDVGICMYYFDNALNSIEEEIYIPYRKSFGYLKEDIDKLSYVNRRNELYLYLGGNIYSVKVDEIAYKELVDGITAEKIFTSKSGQMIAWEDGNGNVSLMDLNSGSVRQIEYKGSNIQAIGFLDDDFVYGVSRPTDIIKDSTGGVIRPMYIINIEDKKGTILKSYEQEGIYITEAVIGDTAISMERIKYDELSGDYRVTNSDQIMTNAPEKTSKNYVTKVPTEDMEMVTEIALMNNVASSIHLQTPKEVLVDAGRNLEIDSIREDLEYYYVYAKGEYNAEYTLPVMAVEQASLLNGVVINDGQDYIWRKGNRKIRAEIKFSLPSSTEYDRSSLATCLDYILNLEGTPRNSEYLLSHGETAFSILEDNINGDVLNLKGCDLQSVLYYVSEGTPVLTVLEDGEYTVITGYDEKNTILLNPFTGETYRMGMNDSTKMFMEHGNDFVTYVRSKN